MVREIAAAGESSCLGLPSAVALVPGDPWPRHPYDGDLVELRLDLPKGPG